jgi:ABC-2 type transport system permease protein
MRAAHHIRVLGALLRVNVHYELAYRTNTVVNLLVNVMWLGWELLSLSIIFSNTDTLAGWAAGDLIALLGVFRLVHTLMAALVWPNTERFNTGVRDGSLDYTLLQPVSSLFLISFSRIILWRIWDLALGLVLIVVGFHLKGGGVALVDAFSFVLLATSGAAVLYSLWIVMLAVTFWFIKFDNNVTILQALLDAGRYPAMVYPAWLRLVITFVVPIAVATTVPMQALRGDLAWWQVLMYLGVGAASVHTASRIWRAGIKKYSGASS